MEVKGKKRMRVLVIVDMQYDFLTGSLPVENAEEVINHNVEVLKEFKVGVSDEEEVRVILTQDTHSEEYLQTLEGKKLPIVHCVKNTHGWHIHDAILEVLVDIFNRENCFVVEKPTFGSTTLAKLLGEWANKYELTISLTGVCTDICVVSNALLLRAELPNTDIRVIEKATYGTSKEATKAALDVMRSCQIEVV